MGRVRTKEPMRRQGVIRFEMPEDTLPEDHRARLLWRVLQTLDVSAFTAKAKAVEGRAGRDVLSPSMLLTLWLYAISVGVGSAREIARRTKSDEAFRWIVGDKEVGHATLSAFRVGHGAALEKLMTDVLSVLLHKGLLSLDRVAQDGTRVRASASAPSFRREATLLECREQAALHVKAVIADPDPEASEAERLARYAAALDYQQRVEAAIATVQTLREEGKENPRASTTDADARVMKMPDGGFRPGYNIQLATAGSELGGPRTIVGILVTNAGSDMGSVTPMLKDIEARTGKLPAQFLADANHAKHSCIEAATQAGIEVIIAIPKRERCSTKGVSPEVAAWRGRMQTDDAKRAYRARAGLCELSNAHLKEHHGTASVLVRGLAKVTCVALLGAVAANILAHASGWLA
ncbi:MAG: transposase [Labilithrix sp.]|nr:transposase [Labilithrix sp.]MCW5814000.1 transposase [Labilithrix sp.]